MTIDYIKFQINKILEKYPNILIGKKFNITVYDIDTVYSIKKKISYFTKIPISEINFNNETSNVNDMLFTDFVLNDKHFSFTFKPII